jgi:hypothetical protein
MQLRLPSAGVLLIAVACCACGHSRADARADDEAATMSVNALQPESLAEHAAASPLVDACDAECPEVSLFGSPAPGCCRADGACGGRVQIRSRTWVCVQPGADATAEALRGALSRAAAEPVIPDSTCPSQKLVGMTLPGCCRSSGACGLDTQAWTTAAAVYRLTLPAACLDAREAAALVGAPLSDAGPAPSCGAGEGGAGEDG